MGGCCSCFVVAIIGRFSSDFTCFMTLINWLERTIKLHHLFINKWYLKLERANIKMLTRIFANKLAEWIFLILSILCNQNGHKAPLSFYWTLDKFLPCYRPLTFLSLEHLFWKTAVIHSFSVRLRCKSTAQEYLLKGTGDHLFKM